MLQNGEEESEELMDMTVEELQHWIQKEVDKDDALQQERAKLAQVEEWVKQREREATYTRLLYSNASQSALECESVMKGLYGMLGLDYRDTDSEEESGASMPASVTQIADDKNEDEAVSETFLENDRMLEEVSAAIQRSSHMVENLVRLVGETPTVAATATDLPPSPSSPSTVSTPENRVSQTSVSDSTSNSPTHLNTLNKQPSVPDDQRDSAETAGRKSPLATPKSRSKPCETQTRPAASPRTTTAEEALPSSANNAPTSRKRSGSISSTGDKRSSSSTRMAAPTPSHGTTAVPRRNCAPPSNLPSKASTSMEDADSNAAATSVHGPSVNPVTATTSSASPSGTSSPGPVAANTTVCRFSPAAVVTPSTSRVSQPQSNTSSQPKPSTSKKLELKVDMPVLGRRRTKTWCQGTLIEIQKTDGKGCKYKVQFDEGKGRSLLSGNHVAFVNPPLLKQLHVGARVVANYKEDGQSWLHSAIVAELPDRKNRMRFLVFYDDGSSAYVALPELHLVCKPLAEVCEDIEDEGWRAEAIEYLSVYPNPIIVLLRPGQDIRVERDGKWEDCRVAQLDGSLVQIQFGKDDYTEWVYKGSGRLEHILRIKKRMADHNKRKASSAVKHNTKPTGNTMMSSSGVTSETRTGTATMAPSSVTTPSAGVTMSPGSRKINMRMISQPRVVLNRITCPVVTSSMNSPHKVTTAAGPISSRCLKSGTKRHAPSTDDRDSTSQEPSALACPSQGKYAPHRCCPACLDGLRPPQPDLHRGQNPLQIPLLFSFRRMTARRRIDGKISFHVFYRAPCWRSLCEMEEIQDFLMETRCDFLFLEMFCLDPLILVNRAPLLGVTTQNKPRLLLEDISEGREVLPIPCYNEVDHHLPPTVNYIRNRVPVPGVSINTNPDFLVGCDCTDGCRDRLKCSCHQLTIESTALYCGGPVDVTAGYTHKRLTQCLPTGVYECNPLCRCDPKMCCNRLVQHGLQLRLQLFMTQHKGWGVRCQDDVPKGTFICVFSGQIVTDDTANVEGPVSGDDYLANLDYIEGVEKLKEGYESEAHCSESEAEEGMMLASMATRPLQGKKTKAGQSRPPEVDNSSGGGASKLGLKEIIKHEDKKDVRMDGPDDEVSDVAGEEYKLCLDGSFARASILSKSHITRRKILQEDHPDGRDGSSSKPCFDPDDSKRKKVDGCWTTQRSQEGLESRKIMLAKTSTRCFAIKSSHRRVKPLPETKRSESWKKEPCKKTIRSFFDGEQSCYIIDARQAGNIGRYLNHSCSPNLFVQNIFFDTHDLRFPWVALFASKRVSAGTELTWDYNYEVGSVDGKLLLCCCGSSKCKGRLL